MQPLSYELIGASYQTVRFTLPPGQTVIGEAGSMMFMDDGIAFECRTGDGSLHQEPQGMFGGMFGQMKNMGKRKLGGESLFNTWFTNTSGKPAVMCVAAPKLGTIVPVKLNDLPSRIIFAQSGAFLCSAMGVKFEVQMVKNIGVGVFGGEGFILQKMTAEQGSSGELFMHGGGTIIRKDLKNEQITIEAGSLMAFTAGIDYDIGFPGFANGFFGGSLFMAKLGGTGSVWVQSCADCKLIDKIIARIPQKQKEQN